MKRILVTLFLLLSTTTGAVYACPSDSDENSSDTFRNIYREDPSPEHIKGIEDVLHLFSGASRTPLNESLGRHGYTMEKGGAKITVERTDGAHHVCWTRTDVIHPVYEIVIPNTTSKERMPRLHAIIKSFLDF